MLDEKFFSEFRFDLFGKYYAMKNAFLKIYKREKKAFAILI